MTDKNSRIDAARRTFLVGGASAAAVAPFKLAATQPASGQSVSGQSTSPSAAPMALSPATQPSFDPKNFPVVPPKRFSDFKVGDMFRMPSRTLTGALTSAFQAVSLDNNPLHYDDDYAKRKGLPSALVQPMEVLAFSAPGASLFTLYLADILIAFTDLSCQFLKPNFAGDTMYSAIQVKELTKDDGKGYITMAITIHNQKNELVLTGEQKFLVKL